MRGIEEIRAQIVSLVRDFVRRDVAPVAAQYDQDDINPAELVDTMREMGLFGITIPEEYGGLGLTEPEAGSDVQNISTTGARDDEDYVLNGSKVFITNAENGNAFAVLAKTDTEADPPYRGMSCFILEKPNPGLTVGRHIDKLGYRGLDTAELLFEDCRVGEEDLVAGSGAREDWARASFPGNRGTDNRFDGQYGRC